MGPGLEVTRGEPDPWSTTGCETWVKHVAKHFKTNFKSFVPKIQAFMLAVRLLLKKVSLDNLGVCGKGVPLVAGSSIFP